MNKSGKKYIEEALAQINEWNKGLEPLLRNGKYKKMARSPYYFFRGTNHLYWRYFAEDKRLKKFSAKNAQTWIQADLHAYNYGIYGADEGELVYGLNDFDEACIANYQFDLWRMAASMVLIARENEFFERESVVSFIASFTGAYVDLLSEYLEKGEEVLYQITKKNAYGKLDETIEQVEKKESRKEMLKQWTTGDEENLVFDLAYEKLGLLDDGKAEEIRQALSAYLQTLNSQEGFDEGYFEILDVARRISSGTGSYGTPRYYILIKGKEKGKYEQRILDVKLQQKPSPYRFLNDKFGENYDVFFENEGQRHKKAYLALNCYTDKHLGWMELSEGVFSVRERSPYKAYFETKILSSATRFNKIAQQWGRILATSHIRAGAGFDVKGLFELIGKDQVAFEALVAEIALEYAEYNNVVYKSFMNKLFLDE
jgi:predicted RNA-binding protein with RPS1 domain